jgi:hypothetical protein
VELDTDHRSYSAVRERVRALIRENRRIKESDRFCMTCSNHHMAGLRRKNVVPEKTVGGVCTKCKTDNAEHVLKAGMCPTCWKTHQRTCLRNEYAEDGVTCEKCHATECGGQHWYTGSEEGTYLCRKCYKEKARAEHRIQGTKCAKCGKSECGGEAWYKGSEDGTYLCQGCYLEKTREAHRALGTKCAKCGKSECGGEAWYKGSRRWDVPVPGLLQRKKRERHTESVGQSAPSVERASAAGKPGTKGPKMGRTCARHAMTERGERKSRAASTRLDEGRRSHG